MEPVRFRADEILYAQSTLTPNCAASCAKAPLPASYAPRSFCRRSLLYAFAISTTSTNAKRLQRISLYTFWKFALELGESRDEPIMRRSALPDTQKNALYYGDNLDNLRRYFKD